MSLGFVLFLSALFVAGVVFWDYGQDYTHLFEDMSLGDDDE